MLTAPDIISRRFFLRSRTYLILFPVACACAAALLTASFSQRELKVGRHAPETSAAGSTDHEMDAALERAARAAIGSQDGTVIVMDAQSGRLRAVVNPQAAFAQASAPGSAIKPFTALAALRAHLVDGQTRRFCRTRYTYKELAIDCPHQKSNVSFDLTHALAYSCNYFFGKLGEGLETGSFDEMLGSFGFGAPTGVKAMQAEASGSLPQGEWRAGHALGESEQLLVTPIQLITAYTALVNGGHLFVPGQAEPANFQTTERARLTIAPEHRTPIVEGMKGAVRYGTAANAGLDTLPLEVFGKTGTSTMLHDYRSQGWFVGFAAERDAAGSATPPQSVRLAVLVFLKRSRGADCARAARAVFAEYAKRRVEDEKGASEEQPGGSDRTRLPAARVRVHLVSQNTTRDLSLEEYVLGVLAAEGSLEVELESLKALAVVSRAFALHNLQRHASEGFDFCNTTHCQRYLFTLTDERKHARFKNLLKRAVTETGGETLRDEEGRIADAYFHAACGGMTSDIETLWGVGASSYLSGVSDEYCSTAQHRWVNVIPAAKLAKALQGDPRSDVGTRLENIVVTNRDRTGRAQFITLEGEHSRVLRGWDFKLIVGRALGWNMLKSSRFDVTRAGRNFIFRGEGFGHGLGLCQEGAHALARRRGASYRQILQHYFPGTSIGGQESPKLRTLSLPDAGVSRIIY